MVMATVGYGMAQSSPESAPSVDLAAWLDGRRQAIMKAIQFHDGEANTLEIREYGSVPRGSFNHHVDLLLDPPENLRAGLDWLDGGLIEKTGTVEIGMPSPARQFALTDAGERALSEVGINPGVSADDVRDLKKQVAELEEENETLKESFNHMADVIDKLLEETGVSPPG